MVCNRNFDLATRKTGQTLTNHMIGCVPGGREAKSPVDVSCTSIQSAYATAKVVEAQVVNKLRVGCWDWLYREASRAGRSAGKECVRPNIRTNVNEQVVRRGGVQHKGHFTILMQSAVQVPRDSSVAEMSCVANSIDP
jgi:hypothetical protein